MSLPQATVSWKGTWMLQAGGRFGQWNTPVPTIPSASGVSWTWPAQPTLGTGPSRIYMESFSWGSLPKGLEEGNVCTVCVVGVSVLPGSCSR